MSKQTFKLNDSRRFRALIVEAVMNAPTGHVVTIQPATRTLEQNALLWALLTALSEQVEWFGQRLSPEDWKDILTAGLRKARVVPDIHGTGFVVLGQRTSTMNKAEFSDLIELIYQFGAERGVDFARGRIAA